MSTGCVTVNAGESRCFSTGDEMRGGRIVMEVFNMGLSSRSSDCALTALSAAIIIENYIVDFLREMCLLCNKT